MLENFVLNYPQMVWYAFSITSHSRLENGTLIELVFDIPLLICPVIGNQHKGSGLSTLRHGTLILGAETSEESVEPDKLISDGNGSYHMGDIRFAPLDQAYLMEEQNLKSTSYRILYRVKQ